MHSYKVEAVVVRRRNFLEKDRILTLFSREEGKIEVVAKGARRPGSKLSYLCDIGLVGTFRLHRAKTLDLVEEITPLFLPERARGEFARAQKLGFLFKLVDRLYHSGDPHPVTFKILCLTVTGISERDYPLIFLTFILRMLDDLGLRPELYRCVECHKKIASSEKLVFSLRSGLAHQSCTRGESEKISPADVKLLRLIFEWPFKKVSRSKVDPKVAARTYQIAQKYLRWHFGEILPEQVL